MKKLMSFVCFVLIVNLNTAQVSKSRFETPFDQEETLTVLNSTDELRPELPFNDSLNIITQVSRNAIKPTQSLVKSVQATVIKSVNITAGGLVTALTSTELHTVTNLTITGTIDARDFKTMRDSLTVLAVLDISAVTIATYTGTAGTSSATSSTSYSYPANAIPNNAFLNPSTFSGKTSLVSIILPLSTTSIGNVAFQYCSSLTSINLPASVTTIGSNAFVGCSGLTNITIPTSVSTISSGVFQNCTGLTSITIPSSVTSIGSYVFQGCSKLTTINVDANNLNYSSLDGVLYNKLHTTIVACAGAKTGSFYIPSSVTTIGDFAFYSCKGLTAIIIPSTVTTIGNNSFFYCSGLTSINIPSSVTLIGSSCFSSCNNLSTITVESSNINYSSLDGILFNKNQTTLIQYPKGKIGGSYSIPATVTSIGENAFYYCSGLTSILIPSSVSTIGNYAFYFCSGLTSITIPSSVTSIGTYAFYYCSKLTSLNIPSSVTSIGSSAFYYCSGLTSIYVNSKPITLTSSSVFSGVNTSTCILNVPYNTKTLYTAASYWNSFVNILEATSGFVLDINKMNIPGTAGSTTVNISANSSWTTSSDQSWLTVSPSSGTGNNTLTLTAEANQTSSVRTAIVTVSASGIVSQTITVIQAKNVYVNAGGLSTSLTATELATLTDLSIIGTLDARDFKILRDNMPLLANLDLSGVTIAAYSGTAGTYSTSSTVYPANEIPADAFYNPSNGIGKVGLTTVILPLNATSIGNYAFQRCSGLTSVTIPTAVTSIGNSAFYYCIGLTRITIPSAVTSIGVQAFSSCTKLTAINVETNNWNYSSIDGVLFDKNQNTLIQYPNGKAGVSYIIPTTVNSIGDYAFYYCSVLTSVTIPSSVTSIGASAFNSCSGLTSVSIPSSVASIGASAFVYCNGLTSVNIPSAVRSIGVQAFIGCTKLTSITVESGNLYYSGLDGILFNKNQTTLIQYPNGKTGVSYSIPATVSSIGDYSFSNCASLTSITIPNSITSIGNNAFYYCSGLTSFSIPSSVTNIGNSAFFYCSGLSSINIPSSVTSIGTNAFYYCSGLTSIYVNSKPIVLATTSSVFSGVNTTSCTLYVPYSTKTLYTAANYWNSFVNIIESTSGFVLDVNSLNVSASAGGSNVSIAANVAWDTSSNQSWLTVSPGSGSGNSILAINIQGNTSDISRTATITVSAIGVASQTITVVQNGIPKSIYLTPGSLASTFNTDQLNGISDLTITGAIDARDFKTLRDNMPMLTKLDLSGVNIVAYTGTEGTFSTSSTVYPANEVPADAFYNPNTGTGKISLVSVIIPLSTSSIGGFAFCNCSGLTSITIPTVVTNIGGFAFTGCSGFTSITIPSVVTTIGLGAFTNCSKLIAINVESNNWNYSSIDGVLFDKNQNTLIQYPNGKAESSYIIPATVDTIGDYSFRYCTNLTSITIPTSVLSIGYYSFYNCTGLTGSLIIPVSVTSIGDYSFAYCSGLTSVAIPTSVTNIGSRAFQFCSGLKSLAISASITAIGGYTFYNCSGLTSIYAYSPVPVDLNSSSSVFYNVNKTTCTLFVPTGSRALYQTAVQWKDFINIVEMTTDIKSVLDNGSFHIYPNPVMDAFKIDGFEGTAKLTVFDLNGRLLLQQQVTVNEAVNISTLSKGMYLLKLITDKGTLEQKIVKK